MTLKVITNFIYPPIPIRCFDWVAYFDGYEESGLCEHGETEAIAIERLMRTQGMTPDGKCTHCGAPSDKVMGCAVGGCPIGNDL